MSVVRVPYLPGRPIRVGTVLTQEGELYLVRWDDGAEEEIKPGEYELLAPRDSLRFASFVDAEAVRADFEADPLGIVLRVLGENGTPMTRGQIATYLVDLGVERKRFAAKWRKVQTALASTDGVTVSGEATDLAFAWDGELAVEPVAVAEES
ncbi:hypothetical protein ADL15_28995 [Actinoplanes awajinensis subsp. mycoplanecinus]|uniref:Uncharacterized protein n=1 Tax=Actinoplanes awajinensis subsp. mycoplanecinus TaxID=135947 RepID=A0A124G9J9_9ACTN|nr:hypothetical protein ADL15_28995 [Actinoplanes awajinensis subsp. mycoplanecinus]